MISFCFDARHILMNQCIVTNKKSNWRKMETKEKKQITLIEHEWLDDELRDSMKMKRRERERLTSTKNNQRNTATIWMNRDESLSYSYESVMVKIYLNEVYIISYFVFLFLLLKCTKHKTIEWPNLDSSLIISSVINEWWLYSASLVHYGYFICFGYSDEIDNRFQFAKHSNCFGVWKEEKYKIKCYWTKLKTMVSCGPDGPKIAYRSLFQTCKPIHLEKCQCDGYEFGAQLLSLIESFRYENSSVECILYAFQTNINRIS